MDKASFALEWSNGQHFQNCTGRPESKRKWPAMKGRTLETCEKGGECKDKGKDGYSVHNDRATKRTEFGRNTGTDPASFLSLEKGLRQAIQTLTLSQPQSPFKDITRNVHGLLDLGLSFVLWARVRGL